MSNEIIERMAALPGHLHNGLAQAAGLVIFAQPGESGALAYEFAAHLLEKATCSVHDYSTLEAGRILDIASRISVGFEKFVFPAITHSKLIFSIRLASAFSWCDPEIFHLKLLRPISKAEWLATVFRSKFVMRQMENVA